MKDKQADCAQAARNLFARYFSAGVLPACARQQPQCVELVLQVVGKVVFIGYKYQPGVQVCKELWLVDSAVSENITQNGVRFKHRL